MKRKTNKKNLFFRWALNTVIFVFSFSFALRTAFLKDIYDLFQKLHMHFEGVISEYSISSFLGIVNRILIAISIVTLPWLIFISNVLTVVYFVFISHILYNFFDLIVLKKIKNNYFNKANSKQTAYIDFSRLLC